MWTQLNQRPLNLLENAQAFSWKKLKYRSSLFQKHRHLKAKEINFQYYFHTFLIIEMPNWRLLVNNFIDYNIELQFSLKPPK